MEADILPVTTCLITRPDSAVALSAGPSVQGDDEWASSSALTDHDLGGICDPIETKRVSCTDPRHVGLEYPHACGAYLFIEITLQKWLYALDRMEVALSPETDIYTMLVRISAILS